MHIAEYEKKELQMATLPSGFHLVELGPILEGDIRWNCWNDCWNISDPVQSPRHDVIIGNPVTITHGICRKFQNK